MIKLINILKEIIITNNLNLGNDYISAYDISKKLEPNPKEIYDFGGGGIKSHFGNKAVVIDKFDLPKKGNPDNQTHDLNQYIELPPRKLINMVYSFYNFQNSSEIKKTIDKALKPGGYLVVQDYNNNLGKLKSIFKNYKIIYEYIYEGNDVDDDEDEDDGFYVIVYTK
jgi:hypothetical protein